MVQLGQLNLWFSPSANRSSVWSPLIFSINQCHSFIQMPVCLGKLIPASSLHYGPLFDSVLHISLPNETAEVFHTGYSIIPPIIFQKSHQTNCGNPGPLVSELQTFFGIEQGSKTYNFCIMSIFDISPAYKGKKILTKGM